MEKELIRMARSVQAQEGCTFVQAIQTVKRIHGKGVFVLRYTNTPLQDVEEGWSGFQGLFNDVEAEEILGFNAAREEAEEAFFDRHEDASDDDFDVWWREVGFLDFIEEAGIVKSNRPYRGWVRFHHYGLSCWELSSSNIEDARRERPKGACWGEWGQKTVGKVYWLGPAEPVDANKLERQNAHIFWAEAVEDE